MLQARTVGELLRLRAAARPEALAYTFLDDGEEAGLRLTYAQLDARASALAAHLARLGASGERAVLMFPPGLDFISAFFGCLYAGTLAVPAYPPDPTGGERGLRRLRAIARDAGAAYVLTTGEIAELARPFLPEAPELGAARWIGVEAIFGSGERWEPRLDGGLAFLQYTSGSTQTPRGVRVTHANLLHNLAYLHLAESNDAESVSVSWLPMYHDMGLIEGTLLPVYSGRPAYLMPPHAFLQRPARWLQALSRYRATHSGGPNFAFDLCVRKVTGEARAALDLSAWRVAYSGAEPVRGETLERFFRAFAPQGFRRSSFYPVYGLAEATLLVTSRPPTSMPTLLELEAGALEVGEVVSASGEGTRRVQLAGVGLASFGVEVRIADPATDEERPPGRVGEIWLRSPSVAEGYWNQPAETARVFGVKLTGGEGPFLRTGDLGFLHEGELFVTGRLKDLVILRGRNHYPQDLERTVEAAHPAIRPGCSAAFSVTRGGEERLAVVAEVDPSRVEGTLDGLVAAIRGALVSEHGVAPGTVCLIPPRAILKTSSGKLQRRACREALEASAFEVQLRWDAPDPGEGREPTPAAQTLAQWMSRVVAEQLGLGAEAVDLRRPVAQQGLDSLGSMLLLGALSEHVGREIPVEALSEHRDLESLARFALSAPRQAREGGAEVARMRRDAILPEDIQPSAEPADPGAPALLTGATGALGAQLLHDLLESAPRGVVCLVRAASAGAAAARVRGNLVAWGLWSEGYAERIRCIPADLGLPRLGLSEADWGALARETSAVFHAAAAVNWVFPYAALREVNVLATRELLRLACEGVAKPFHFVSSQLVCLGTARPRREVTEEDDLLDEIEGLHLGYAQTKCVAERLVSVAGARGLPTRIYRPPFLFGSARSGRCSSDDFLAALIKGCIQLGCAPDLDWELDCCPVDHLSALIVEVSRQTRAGSVTLHPPLPKPRHWRECVLWMGLFGYPVKLVPHAGWLHELEHRAVGPEHALFFLRPFFLSRLETLGGYTRSELYETHCRNPVGSAASRAALAGWAVECPRLEASLLERYFQWWVSQGHLPAVARAARSVPGGGEWPPEDAIARALREHGGGAEVVVERMGRRGEHSITNELTAWKHARGIGLFWYRVRQGGGERSVLVKAKASDAEVIDVAVSVAAQCGRRLGGAVERHASLLGFTGCHHRELEIYGQRDPRFTGHAPEVFFRERDDARGVWLLGLEDLRGRALMDTVEDASAWGRPEREAALRGLVALHAIGFPHGTRGWPRLSLAPAGSARGMAGGVELWAALEEHARPFFAEYAGPELPALHRRLIASVERWWRPMEELPRTLIHHDFNPRNIALRRTPGGLRLCAYDWELATEGLPQRDLAELLAFTLDARSSAEEIEHCVELHRSELERASGQRIDPGDWRAGLAAALGDLLVNRLSLYTVVHRFQRQGFLPRVVRTWARLHAHYPIVSAPAPRPRAVGEGRHLPAQR